jgi:5-bromo-4-chloroindolyl phosphate hydrolysis protein
MKILALGIFASVSGIGAGAVAEDVFIQYGALAILGGILCYMLVWTLPTIVNASAAQREDFLAAQKEDRKVALEAAKATRHDFRDSLSNLTRAVDNIASATSEARRSKD